MAVQQISVPAYGTSRCSWFFRPQISFDKLSQRNRCLDYQFRPRDQCDEQHERRVEACVQALLEAEDNNPPPKESGLVTYKN